MVGKDESDPRVLLSDGRKVCEHCRHLGPAAIRGLPETPWVSSLPGRFALHLGYWIKAVLQVTFTMAWEFIWAKGSIFKGAAVAGILITPLYKHCSPWETVSVTHQLFHSSSCWLLPKLFPMFLITTLVLLTASQLDAHMPAKGRIFV